MAANVETMMYVREKPWHGLGTMVQEAPTSADALRLAGLNWRVEPMPLQVCGGRKVENYKANVRSTDGAVLGVVSDRYRICQNTDAFDFTDSLIGGDVRYETAGSLQGGRKIWLLAKLPETKVIDDSVVPYLCFTNSHDGSGAIRAIMTPVRVVCNNTLNLALNTAKRSWAARHTGNIEAKLEEAKLCLELADKYMYELNKTADKLANITVTDEQIQQILSELFPVKETASDREKENAKKIKDEYMVCWYMPDIAKFRNTAWGAVNAMSDMVCHTKPLRNTQNYAENNWGRIMDGHAMLDKMMSLLSAKV